MLSFPKVVAPQFAIVIVQLSEEGAFSFGKS